MAGAVAGSGIRFGGLARPETPQRPARRERPRINLLRRATGKVQRDLVAPVQSAATGRVRAWRNADRSFRPVFVAGAMGSGTTLLALALWQRFDVAAAVRESVLEMPSRSFLSGRPIATHASIHSYEASLEPQPQWTAEAARQDMLGLYRSRAAGASDWVVDKGPNAHLVRAEFLAECFPESRFVLVFRDPVANIEGFRRKWPVFGREPLQASIDFYRRTHERFLDAMWTFSDRVVALSYETLVEKHDETLQQISRTLGLPFASATRRLEARPNTPGCGLRNVEGGRIGVVADANRSAYARLAEADVDTIRRELGPLHDRLRLAAI